MKTVSVAFLLLGVGLWQARSAQADEGMWTFDNPPTERLSKEYRFKPTEQWLEHVRLSAVRFNDGGSGAFVSAEGLVLTNHHVAFGQLQKMSTPERDYIKNGFFARKPSQEIKCPDLEINQLISMENVTERVTRALTAKQERQRNEQRKAEISRIEKESTDSTGLRSDVVELYEGGEYWLYRYKKFTDVRIVAAPEQQAAFFGGDPDNFTFPRYDLDFAFFRVYENGKPLRSKHYLRFRPEGLREGDLTFVVGHPGRTDRLETARQLVYQLDIAMPTRLEQYRRRREALVEYSKLGPEQERRAKDRLFAFENSIKAMAGELEGLREWGTTERMKKEKEFRAALAKRQDLRGYASAIDRLAKASDLARARASNAYRHNNIFAARLASFANTIARLVAELEKPNDKRYAEFRESALDSLKHRLFSPAPIYPDMEERMIFEALQESLEKLGPGDPYVKLALQGRTPQAQAKYLVSGTKLADPAERKRLIEGGSKAVAMSTDPLIVWARSLDPSYRAQRKEYEDEIEAVMTAEGNRLARARFALYGKTMYPDATFTLRLSYGRVAGYDQGTTKVPWKTTFWGLFERSAAFDNKPPFDLPPHVAAARRKIRYGTALNFVTTNDIIGGNSGSPVVDRNGNYVGLIFDGNIQSLGWQYAFDETQSRAVAVHAAGIVEALCNIYDMPDLVRELFAR
jgi:peptidase S46-like protein